MLCLRCSRLARPSPLSTLSALRSALPKPTPSPISRPSQSRSLTLLTATRPRLASSQLEISTSPVLSALTTQSQTTSSTLPPQNGPGPLLLVRGAKRDTYDPSHRVRKRRHGFLARLRSRTGKKMINRRRTKGRVSISH
ncbi:putative ribosomal protein L34 [Elsinoe australis]|uniref:Large ribosomal subunit protein bL34m n=1 Tax=Elsinoe australis TaxID=40998 RepID=A0A4V6DXG7_9PEZI|nr:putative ribosomal protein L34 [Elsinoe australis]